MGEGMVKYADTYNRSKKLCKICRCAAERGMPVNHSMDVTVLSKACYNYLTEYGTKYTENEGKTFVNKLVEKTGAGNESRATDHMTMTEYKCYIYDKISRLPIHPSQAGWFYHIQITDEGFAAMKNDPAYEKFVLDTIRDSFSQVDFYQGENVSLLHFGATKEEFRAETYHIGSPFERKMEEKAFWERKAERKRIRKEQYENWLDRRAVAKRIRQRLVLEKNLSQAAAIAEANAEADGIASSVILSKRC